METIIKDQVGNAFSGGIDTSGQPWYWRWGVAALGTLGGLILLLVGLTHFTNPLAAILSIILAVVLVSFEATALAKGFNWAFCQALTGVADKITPLYRTIIYGGLSIGIMTQGITLIFGCLPALACAALYFLLFLDQRNSGGDTQPVVEEGPDFA